MSVSNLKALLNLIDFTVSEFLSFVAPEFPSSHARLTVSPSALTEIYLTISPSAHPLAFSCHGSLFVLCPLAFSRSGSLAVGFSICSLSLLCPLCSLAVDSPSVLTVDCISRLASPLLSQLQWSLAAVVDL
ncbi:hypothetical protein WN944_026904 [Citrus x changshan-huyou]|uniref:Uncharacterized protein n=1 Tax=Citrus x changshan-huyou TaxID=2935761 RepID=A0AAP0LHH2_9ROSI